MSAFLLRLIACLAMLLDHIGYYQNSMFLRAIGRVAFPIFIYLIYNGYRHTSCRWRYALRLALFALISQVPFSLFCTRTVMYLHGNVFFTLLIALLCVWTTDLLRKTPTGCWFCCLPAVTGCILYQLNLWKSDYGARGIILIMAFYLFDGKEGWKRLLILLFCLIAAFYNPLVSVVIQLLRGEWPLLSLSQWDWWQGFSVLALPLIFLYNGTKGFSPQSRLAARFLQWSFYLFYPVHLLILWLICIL